MNMNENNKEMGWVKIPTEQASQEEWARFFNELGRPSEATAYQFTPAAAQFYDSALAEDFKAIAHKAGLNQKQAQIVHDEMVRLLEEKYKEAQGRSEYDKQNILQKLQQKWGANYGQNIKQAQEGARHLGLKPQDIDNLENIMGSEEILEALMRMGSAFKKDNTLMQADLQPAALSVQTAKQKRAELSRDESFLAALMDKSHPAHKEAIAELDRLNQVIVSQ